MTDILESVRELARLREAWQVAWRDAANVPNDREAANYAHKSAAAFRDAADRIDFAALAAEMVRLREDAEDAARYRWIRDNGGWSLGSFVFPRIGGTGCNLAAAIDRARKESET